jgi:membrane-bound lytic murein transglycosylase F
MMQQRRMITWGIPLLVVGAGVGHGLLDGGPVPEEVKVAWSDPLVERDLDTIASDTLRVLVIEDPLTWEVRPKAVSGLEYDLLRRFAGKAGLHVTFTPMHHPDSMLMALQRGEGDLIAAQWTPRPEQRQWVRFSEPYRYVRPMLAVLREDPVPVAPGTPVLKAAASDTVELSLWSPFVGSDYAFDEALGHNTRIHVDPAVLPEEQLMSVVMGRHHAAIVTDARAAYEADRFPVLEFTGPLGEARPLCFVVRRNAPALLGALNTWLEDADEKEARRQFIAAYEWSIKGPGALKARNMPIKGDSISPFDEVFQRHAHVARWGWELLAVMAYKESRFDTTVVSSKGAQGLMQIMPRTGAKLGLDSTAVVSDHIRAAARYIAKLDTMWMRAVTDREQRLRFVLASYNAGPGHIIDAQRLAERLGLDPARWEHNVERAVLLLAKPRYYMEPGMKNGYCKGSQVFHYVRDVTAMYSRLKAHKRATTGIAEARSGTGSPE